MKCIKKLHFTYLGIIILGIIGVMYPKTLYAQNTIKPVKWKHLSSEQGDLPAPNGGTQQTASQVVDIDGNGVKDFVITERTQAPSIVWYRRTNKGWDKYIIDNSQLPIEAGGAHYDIDGDGDQDLVFGADYSDNRMWWWENPAPNFDPSQPWIRRLIKASGKTKHHDELFGDFDADGQTELVFWNQGAKTLNIADIPKDPKHTGPWNYTPIYQWKNDREHEGLAAADVDGDSIIDIVGGGHWFKHFHDNQFIPIVLDPNYTFTRAAAGQFVEGGPSEVVFVPGDANGPIKFYQTKTVPTDPTTWSHKSLLDTAIVHGHSIDVGDINQDGHLDIFNAEMYKPGHGNKATMRIFYGHGDGSFTIDTVHVGIGNHESKLADLDGDGDLDILDKPYTWDTPRVDIWLNEGVNP